MPQNCRLFNGNILENISSGETDPDINRILSICSSLGLEELIKKLPSGLFTRIERNGGTLSGGEMQRIAFARSLYGNPGIYIFDEATSLLDKVSENLILNKIKDLRDDGATIIMITHKESNMKIADKKIKLN